MLKPEVSIVVPLYNEEEGFSELTTRLDEVMKQMPFPIEVVLVNDGSADRTAELMEKVAYEKENYHCVFLARNFGHQLAVSAGLKVAKATKAVLIIDGDLQDPPELLPKMYAKFKEGFDVVYAIRKNRKESALKKACYSLFYRFLRSISYIDIPLDSGDFSLISARVVKLMNDMPEESRFLRGMRTWIGFKQVGIEYERSERFAGEPKYTFKALFRLAYDGIFNFSLVPIRFIGRLGMVSFAISFVYLITVLFKKVFYDNVPLGFTAILITIMMFGSVQLISIGVLGEYLVRVFFQVKKRPHFIIDYEIIQGKKTNEIRE